MADLEKRCPKCQEKVKLLAEVCKHCGYQFSEAHMEVARKTQVTNQKTSMIVGIGCLSVIVIAALGMCGKSDTPSGTSAVQTEAANADDRRKGFHCLSSWDGSNRSLVSQVKAQLRDPGSFEHAETKITPVMNGAHTVSMTYRARNGFGGMNVATALATVNPVTCTATVISTGE